MLQQQKNLTEPDSLNPDDVAQMVIEAMKEKRFLILTPHTEDILAEAMKRGRDFHKLEIYLQANYKDETTGKSWYSGVFGATAFIFRTMKNVILFSGIYTCYYSG